MSHLLTNHIIQGLLALGNFKFDTSKHISKLIWHLQSRSISLYLSTKELFHNVHNVSLYSTNFQWKEGNKAIYNQIITGLLAILIDIPFFYWEANDA